MRVSLRWQQTGTLPLDTQIKLAGDGWDTVATYRLDPVNVQLAWYALTIPANAKGKATLEASSGNSQPVNLGEYDFGNIDRVFSESPVGQAVNASFAGVGELTRFNAPDSVKNGQSFPITLVWKATTTPSVSYTVFVHLLDASGQVVAQSDALPFGGNRPTTGWVAGECLPYHLRKVTVVLQHLKLACMMQPHRLVSKRMMAAIMSCCLSRSPFSPNSA
jgi:hypothetical protein